MRSSDLTDMIDPSRDRSHASLIRIADRPQKKNRLDLMLEFFQTWLVRLSMSPGELRQRQPLTTPRRDQSQDLKRAAAGGIPNEPKQH
jgi:hypothetical protein